MKPISISRFIRAWWVWHTK